MGDTFFVGAYWGPRREIAEACAARAVPFLSGLAEKHSLFNAWFEKGRTLKEALRKNISFTPERLTALFEAGVNRRDTDNSIIEDLGFRISAWTGRRVNAENATLSIHAGCYSEHLPSPNNVIVNLPREDPTDCDLITATKLAGIVELLVDCWDPDWATVTCHEFLEIAKLPVPGIKVGWILFVSKRLGAVPAIEHPSKVRSIPEKGTIIISTEERFCSANPAHVAQAMKVIDRLRRAGLLKR